MQAVAVTFKRTDNKSPLEVGIMVTGKKGMNLIVDREGLVVPAPIWNYHEEPQYGCFSLATP